MQHPKYHQNRRLQQAKMQRKVRKSQRRLSQLRALWRLFIIIFLIFLGVVILKLPQWRLHSNAFDNLSSPALEITNNRIVQSQKILSALRRNQVCKKPSFPIISLSTPRGFNFSSNSFTFFAFILAKSSISSFVKRYVLGSLTLLAVPLSRAPSA